MSASAVRVPVGLAQPSALEAWVDDAGNLVIPAAALPGGRRGSASVVLERSRGVERGSPTFPRRGLLALVVLALLLIGVIATFAAHGRQWPWTGFAGSTSLWSWLRLLVQPIALAFLTVRLLTDAPLRVSRRVCLSGVALMALLILVGYVGRWSWTGFPGKALWDWLSLLLFPAVAVLLPEWIRRGEPFGPVARVGALVALFGFAVLVVGGYHWGWSWTGFTGNTFRDWLDLMIAPFLLPVALRVVHTRHVVRGLAHALAARDELVVQISIPR